MNREERIQNIEKMLEIPYATKRDLAVWVDDYIKKCLKDYYDKVVQKIAESMCPNLHWVECVENIEGALNKVLKEMG